MIDWAPAPFRIEYGHQPNKMLIANIELDKDHTLTLVCEEEAKHLVNAALIRIVEKVLYVPSE